MSRTRPLWAVVPAAGAGQRFGGCVPKQYLPLLGRTVLEWAIRPFLARSDVAGIVVAISPADEHWPGICPPSGRVRAVHGGRQRADSVLAGLTALSEDADVRDWALVHDAARPCLTDEDLDRLVDVAAEAGGGLLAAPVQDTLKAADDGRVARTVEREGLWRALTPQMFRIGELVSALRKAEQAAFVATDEAAAMERAGYRPSIVPGRADNIKITRPEDLALAEFVLTQSGIA
ncbi:MAG: 2-C-methyl-D-erythritol 4-phosphate cytidylyltransferase [Gammaproteobacteria bacterium]|nr:MAG: 2-C-methyl-D-erythritol 4-phosphate cytidylyltransferase [Gammaproteobacteria bacterium]